MTITGPTQQFELDECDKHGACHKLISDEVEEHAELANGVATAGEVAVEHVETSAMKNTAAALA
ncbi:MAG: hypothetical protein WKH64_16255 [Chloroflexia bacterium]